MHGLKKKIDLTDLKAAFSEIGYVDWHIQMSIQDQDHHDDDLDVKVAPPELKRPPLYVVVLLNDDYTPMDIVIEILQQFFAMNLDQATEVMLTVHYEGKGVAGIYPRDIAETKANQVNNYARSQGYPLLCQIEPKQ
ncbi:ATP-dependent Clp protease adapter ClpS [Acinetobacter sp. B5B]|uniref:ATP-dependent Clp protease adapter ClpS n=1 Tax=Acinetobacter baretiae TaxID=2605383 RepID=UPI0018C2F809|nr:ATP-dependent Clp protease adapter ClpS [Acinetobacter baretiae]MBF7683119.1 ATP-dependent Clp protease adapter ClpS [Acinetobacter baretiae]MBF7684513.1 ATP-dependent Clp protease adapter ClpS [Acinetobacter baretiae]